MFFIRNSCLFGCVILSSLLVLHSCVAASTYTYIPNTNRIVSAAATELADVSLSQQSNATTEIHIVGEYNLDVRFNDNVRHAETGEYEMRNGKQVFVVRGIFRYFSAEHNIYITRPYIFDSDGLHEIQNAIDIRVEESDAECDLSTGQYCIDPKLLRLLVG